MISPGKWLQAGGDQAELLAVLDEPAYDFYEHRQAA